LNYVISLHAITLLPTAQMLKQIYCVPYVSMPLLVTKWRQDKIFYIVQVPKISLNYTHNIHKKFRSVLNIIQVVE